MIRRKVPCEYDKKTRTYNYGNAIYSSDDILKDIDDDIDSLKNEIKKLSPVVNLVKDYRKQVKWLINLKELLIKKKKNKCGDKCE